MYHGAVHDLAKRVGARVRKQGLFCPGDRVGIAVSGGADSVALLRLLLELRTELGLVLSVVHFNHKLRGAESDGDEAFVQDLAGQYGLELYRSSGDVPSFAAHEQLSTETAARELRYEFFRQLLGATGEGLLSKVATAHTLDDQDETVLMRIIRGAGTRGVGGIHPRFEVKDVGEDVCGEIVRPLLGVRRSELEAYLREIGQGWREDSSNRELKHTRNRIRRRLMPLLESEFNPAIAEGLSEFSEIARGEEEYWQNEIAGWMGTVVQWVQPERKTEKSGLVQIGAGRLHQEGEEHEEVPLNALVEARWFHSEPAAVQRRVLKAIGEIAGVPLDFQQIEAMRVFAESSSGDKHLDLPLGWRFEKQGQMLAFLKPASRHGGWEYEYVLRVPGRVRLKEAGVSIAAECCDPKSENSDQVFDASKLPETLVVRNWRAGDRYWPAHTKAPKKVKELLQDRHIIGKEKKLWPVVTIGNEVVWVPGFRVPEFYSAGVGAGGILMRVEED